MGKEELSLLVQIQICADDSRQCQLIGQLIDQGGSTSTLNDQLIDAMARAVSPRNLRLAFSGLRWPLDDGQITILRYLTNHRRDLVDLRKQIDELADESAGDDGRKFAVA